jgi:death-on-curing protein
MTLRRKPVFLFLDEVLALHGEQIERYGGATGLRDLGLLESALAAPRAAFGREYLHASLPEMAAAYLYHVVRNHPFLDGNKRAGLAASIAFLGMNGLWLESDPEVLTDLVLGVAEGRTARAEVAEFIRMNTVPWDG